MTNEKKFALLLGDAIEKIKNREAKSKGLIQDELGYACGREGGSYIDYLRRGHIPSNHEDLEKLTQELVRQGGLADRKEVELFLDNAGHPSPAQVLRILFAKVDSPPADTFDIFVGREEKIGELRKVLRIGEVVVLWGAGGVGKTSLVRAVIQQVAPNNTAPNQFPHGILYYDFYGPEHTADDALRYIAGFFGVEVTKDISPRDAASAALFDRRALIVLDGAEQANDLRKVWRIRHQCCLLIVSRHQHIDLAPKTIYLDVLSPDEALAALRAWSADEENKADFQVWGNDVNEDDSNAHDICKELGNLPLALRLAGRYMLYREIKPSKFLKLWREWRLSLIQEGKHQHDSLQVLMEKSLKQVAQVSEGAHEVMVAAGLLSYQSFGTEVIATALEKSSDVVEKLLQDLWKYSLITRVSDERWQVVHRLVYTYAQSLDKGNDLIVRLAAYYTKLAEEQSEQGVEGYAILDGERSHTVAILASCVEREDWKNVMSLASAIDDYLKLQGHWIECITVNEYRLMAAQTLEDKQKEGESLINLGGAYHHLGQVEAAINYHEQALAIFREIENRNAESSCLNNLGLAYNELGQVDSVMECYHQALIIARANRNLHGEATALGNLGGAYHRLIGQLQTAIDYHEQALAILLDIGFLHEAGICLTSLGAVYADMGQGDTAINYHEQALAIALAVGDRTFEGGALDHLGRVHQYLGQLQTAIDYYHQALAIFQETQNLSGEAAALGNLGGAYQQLGQQQIAIDYLQQAIAIFRKIGNFHERGLCLTNLGAAYKEQGQLDTAINYHEQALAILREIGFHQGEGSCLSNLGAIYGEQGQTQTAIDYYHQALAIFQETGYRSHEGRTLGNLGTEYYTLGQVEAAIDYFQQALAIAQETKEHHGKVHWLYRLGRCYDDLARDKEAIDAFQKVIELNPKDLSSHRHLANIYLDLGQLDKAAHYYHRWIELHPTDAIRPYVNLGIIALRRGKEAEAQKYFETALTTIWEGVAKNNVRPSFGLLESKALALLCLGQDEQALASLKEALAERKPGSTIEFTRYDLLAASPHPPHGLADMRLLLEQVIEEKRK